MHSAASAWSWSSFRSGGTEVLARLDEVEHPVLDEELGRLEAVRERLANRLLDHLRAGEADVAARLGDEDVAERRERGSHAAVGRIGERGRRRGFLPRAAARSPGSSSPSASARRSPPASGRRPRRRSRAAAPGVSSASSAAHVIPSPTPLPMLPPMNAKSIAATTSGWPSMVGRAEEDAFARAGLALGVREPAPRRASSPRRRARRAAGSRRCDRRSSPRRAACGAAGGPGRGSGSCIPDRRRGSVSGACGRRTPRTPGTWSTASRRLRLLVLRPQPTRASACLRRCSRPRRARGPRRSPSRAGAGLSSSPNTWATTKARMSVVRPRRSTRVQSTARSSARRQRSRRASTSIIPW